MVSGLMSKSSDILNAIFAEDPEAVKTLFGFRELSESGCSASFSENGVNVISPLSILNKVLKENDLDVVAVKLLEDGEIVGFCDYKL